jgi:hypothetical protein
LQACDFIAADAEWDLSSPKRHSTDPHSMALDAVDGESDSQSSSENGNFRAEAVERQCPLAQGITKSKLAR